MTQRADGFTYVGLLIAVALSGLALAVAGTAWTTQATRDREADLLFVGDQFRSAIASYASATPVGSQTYPQTLEQLVDDKRWPTPRRHLRRMFRDPMTGAADWGLVRNAQGGIVGVHSTAERVTMKRAGFPVRYADFERETVYSRWVFRDTGPQAKATGQAQPQDAPAAGPPEQVAEAPPERPVPSLREDIATRTSEACQRINAADLRTCEEVTVIVSPAAGEICRGSATGRLAACADANAPLPGLFYPRTRE